MLLPEPEGPTTETHSPEATLKLTPTSASTLPSPRPWVLVKSQASITRHLSSALSRAGVSYIAASLHKFEPVPLLCTPNPWISFLASHAIKLALAMMLEALERPGG